VNGHVPVGPAEFLQSVAAARQDVQTLFDASHVSTSHLTLDETLSVLAVRLKRIIPFDGLAIYFVQEEKLIPGYVSGDNYRLFSSLRIPMGQGLSGWVAENRKPIINGNPSVEPGYMNDPNIFSTLRSALSVPLEGTAGIIGVLSLYHEGRDAFTKDHLRLLESIAPKLALSVETACRQQDFEDPAALEALAGLRDGRSLLVHLDAELVRCKRLSLPVAVLVCVVDGLGKVSERLGHVEANRVLRSIVVSMRDACREFDFLARMGGNEFVLVLPGMKLDAVRAKAAKLMQIASNSGEALSLVVGDAYFPDDSENAEQLLAAADRRMFEVKLQRSAAASISNVPMRWVQ
jgi:diguanylate cyclase (GGDEF)-like protein